MLWPHLKLFKDIKRGLELIYLLYFLHNFWRKIFLLLYSINWPNFIVWLLLLCEILGNMSIAIVFKPGWDVMNFENNLIFLIKPFFLHDKNVMTKTFLENKTPSDTYRRVQVVCIDFIPIMFFPQQVFPLQYLFLLTPFDN